MNQQILSATDLCFWDLDTPSNHQAIGYLSTLSSVPDREKLQRRLSLEVCSHSRMRARVTEKRGKFVWEEMPQFIPKENFLWIENSNLSSAEDYAAEASKEFSKGLDLNKPLWRLVVIAGSQAPENRIKAAVIFIVHHAFADGMGGVSLFYSLCDDERSFKSENQRTRAAANLQIMTSPVNLGSIFERTLSAIKDFSSRTHVSSLNCTNSRTRSIGLVNLPLIQARQLRKRLNVSLNELFLIILTEALRGYELKNNIFLQDIHALIPVNIRVPKQNLELGNWLSGIRVRLPISIDNQDKRVETLKQELATKSSNGSAGAYALVSRMLSFLPKSLRRKCLAISARRINLICTNIPAPKSSLSLAGAQIINSYGLPALMAGQGAAFAFVRYREEISVAVVGDSNLPDSATKIAARLEQTFKDLVAQDKTHSAFANSLCSSLSARAAR